MASPGNIAHVCANVILSLNHIGVTGWLEIQKYEEKEHASTSESSFFSAQSGVPNRLPRI